VSSRRFRVLISIYLLLGVMCAGCASATTTAPPATTTIPASSVIAPPTSKVAETTATIPPASTTILPSSVTTPMTSKVMPTFTAVIPYITAEELKVLYDTGNPNGDYFPYALVDVRVQPKWDTAHIQTAVCLPPNIRNDELVQQSIVANLMLLPKDELIVFYDDNSEIEATALAQFFISLDAGYDPANVKILKGGYDRWQELGYPGRSAAQ
jgi:rhodanese-related sulfurtransferase